MVTYPISSLLYYSTQTHRDSQYFIDCPCILVLLAKWSVLVHLVYFLKCIPDVVYCVCLFFTFVYNIYIPVFCTKRGITMPNRCLFVYILAFCCSLSNVKCAKGKLKEVQIVKEVCVTFCGRWWRSSPPNLLTLALTLTPTLSSPPNLPNTNPSPKLVGRWTP